MVSCKNMTSFYAVTGYNELGGGDDDNGNFLLGITPDIEEAYEWCDDFVDGYPSIRSTCISHWRAEKPEQVAVSLKTGRFTGAFCLDE